MYGLRVKSELDLPGWPTLTVDEPDVTIRQEVCSAPDVKGEPYTARLLVEAGELKLVVLGVGRYCASGGSLIRVDPDAGAKGEDLRLYLTGAMLGTILHQRGAFPLHASCVALNGVGVALAGRSGSGKSTLVAAMVNRGASFVTDDIAVVVSLGAEGGFAVWPGAARVKLDQIGLAALPSPFRNLEPAGGTRGKFHVPMNSPTDWTSPVPLSRIYLLTYGEGPARVERLTGLDAISAVVDETYFLTYARAMGLTAQVFQLAATVARILPVMRLIRPRGLEHLPAVVDLLELDGRNP